jgi:uncharacterized protein (DUF2141 family)
MTLFPARFLRGCVAVATMLATGPAFAQLAGPDAAACGDPTAAAVRVRVTGLKNGNGTLRVQAYGANPADFLAKGKWVRRVELPLQGRRALDVCLRLPRFGAYAVAVRHDANGNGKSDWNDGAGFSRNPKLSLLRLKPAFGDVVVPVSRPGSAVSIIMNYRQGFAIGPQRDATH